MSKQFMTECGGCNSADLFTITYPPEVRKEEFEVYHNKCKSKDRKGVAFFILDDPSHKIVWIIPDTKNAYENRIWIRPISASILVWSDFNPDDIEYETMREKIEDVRLINKFYKRKVKESLE